MSTLTESILDPWSMGVLCFKPHVLVILFIAYVMLKWKYVMLEEVCHGNSSKTHSGFSEIWKKFIRVERTTACAFLLFLPPCAIYVTGSNCFNTTLAWFPHTDTRHPTQFCIQHFMHSYLYYCNSILSFFSFSPFMNLVDLTVIAAVTFSYWFSICNWKNPQKMDMVLYEELLIPADKFP